VALVVGHDCAKVGVVHRARLISKRTKNKAEQLRRPCRAVWRKEKRIGVAFD